jgi:hypothetical protein
MAFSLCSLLFKTTALLLFPGPTAHPSTPPQHLFFLDRLEAYISTLVCHSCFQAAGSLCYTHITTDGEHWSVPFLSIPELDATEYTLSSMHTRIITTEQWVPDLFFLTLLAFKINEHTLSSMHTCIITTVGPRSFFSGSWHSTPTEHALPHISRSRMPR